VDRYLKELEAGIDAMDFRKLPFRQLIIDAEKMTKNSC
jgi:hypothetical protein